MPTELMQTTEGKS